MQLPNLDEATKKGLNELTAEEVSMLVSYAYAHEILQYGIEAVAHAYLMRMAKTISEGELSRKDFAKKYCLDFESQLPVWAHNKGVSVPLEKIESDGIFIPEQAYYLGNGEQRGDRIIHLFNDDYGNIVDSDSWVDKDYAWKLMDRIWKPLDLESTDLIEQGIKFGIDMWRTCVEGFEETKKGIKGFSNDESVVSPQPQKVTDLGGKLIAYYSELVSELTLSII